MIKILFLLIAMCRFKFRPCGGSPLTVPTFLYVPDICKIAKQSGLDDGKDFIFTNGNMPLQYPLFIVPDICRIVGRSGLNDSDKLKY